MARRFWQICRYSPPRTKLDLRSVQRRLSYGTKRRPSSGEKSFPLDTCSPYNTNKIKGIRVFQRLCPRPQRNRSCYQHAQWWGHRCWRWKLDIHRRRRDPPRSWWSHILSCTKSNTSWIDIRVPRGNQSSMEEVHKIRNSGANKRQYFEDRSKWAK